jgi:hypothetical protein
MTLCETVSPKLENHPLSVVYVREVSLRYRGPRRGVSFDAVGSPVKAAAFMRRVLPDNVREHFLALFLDNPHRLPAAPGETLARLCVMGHDYCHLTHRTLCLRPLHLGQFVVVSPAHAALAMLAARMVGTLVSEAKIPLLRRITRSALAPNQAPSDGHQHSQPF